MKQTITFDTLSFDNAQSELEQAPAIDGKVTISAKTSLVILALMEYLDVVDPYDDEL